MTKILPHDPSKSHLLTNTAPRRDGQPASAKDTASQAHPQPSGDKAEISTQARELSYLRAAVDTGRAALAETPAATEAEAEKLTAVRQRLASGFYNSAEVRDQVAGKLTAMFMDHPLF
jgi:hypothetical protein